MPEETPKPASTQWLRRREDGSQESVELEALRGMIASGALKGDHYVFDPRLQKWLYAREVPELKSSLQLAAHDPQAWLINLRGKIYPLADLTQVRQWVDEFRIEPNTKVRNPILQRWMNASEILELGPSFDSRPKIIFEEAPATANRATVLILSILGLVVVIAVLAIYQGTHATHSPATVLTAPATVVPEAATLTTAKPLTAPVMHRITFGQPSTDSSATATSSSSDTTATSTATSTSTATAGAATTTSTAAPSAATSTATAEKKKKVTPRRDDAEADLDDENSDVPRGGIVQLSASGDTLVQIDRNGRDPYYHLGACRLATGDMATVSLDLAKHGHSPCPVCKPPR